MPSAVRGEALGEKPLTEERGERRGVIRSDRNRLRRSEGVRGVVRTLVAP